MTEKKGKEEEDKKTKIPTKRYQNRLSTLKTAYGYASKDNIPKAVEGYSEYLGILALYYGVDESQLSPEHFDSEQDLPEILIITQVYWALAKAYDRNTRLQDECGRCLKQFIKFSTGYKFQYVNSQMVKKFIKKNIAYNPKMFKEAYERVYVSSKKCYIATHCFGQDHQNTNLLRDFKEKLILTRLGRIFVVKYYDISPTVVHFCNTYKRVGWTITTLLFRPVLRLMLLFIKPGKR